MTNKTGKEIRRGPIVLLSYCVRVSVSLPCPNLWIFLLSAAVEDYCDSPRMLTRYPPQALTVSGLTKRLSGILPPVGSSQAVSSFDGGFGDLRWPFKE